MKILIITTAYPSEDDLYSNAFVHNRAIEYMNKGMKVVVCVCRRNIEEKKYQYNDILVNQVNQSSLENLLKEESFNKIIIHFLTVPVMRALKNTSTSQNVLVWVHGEEALSWKSRLFNWRQPRFFKYVVSNTIQLKKYKKFVESTEGIKYIFVSEWMKKQSEKDIKTTFKDYSILPNGIDTNFFSYAFKPSKKINILVVRPFTSKKYATDIIIDALLKLSKKKNFLDFNISIYGKGPLLRKQTKILNSLSNVQVYETFLNRSELKREHSRHNIFLCPTRQDAQGVSMCEAMSSGLVPITSNSTAIPEFVNDGESGFLTNSSDEIVNKLCLLNDNRTEMMKISRNAREEILKKCSLEKISFEELHLICD